MGKIRGRSGDETVLIRQAIGVEHVEESGHTSPIPPVYAVGSTAFLAENESCVLVVGRSGVSEMATGYLPGPRAEKGVDGVRSREARSHPQRHFLNQGVSKTPASDEPKMKAKVHQFSESLRARKSGFLTQQEEAGC